MVALSLTRFYHRVMLTVPVLAIPLCAAFSTENLEFLEGMTGKDFFRLCSAHCTEVRFASFLSGRFIIMTVINPPEKKLAPLCTDMKFKTKTI